MINNAEISEKDTIEIDDALQPSKQDFPRVARSSLPLIKKGSTMIKRKGIRQIGFAILSMWMGSRSAPCPLDSASVTRLLPILYVYITA